MTSVELSTFDLRYEGYRLRDDAREARLRASIAVRGIEQPLEGVDMPNGQILLNGFKRYRCARKLGIHHVPYVSLGSDETAGIVNLMRVANDKALGMLEQAKFVVELIDVHGMTVADVAATLSRSKAWVSARRGLLSEMSEAIQATLFRGTFPVYSYMYTLRQFMRLNSVTTEAAEQFVQAVAGKGLSVRDIEMLARGYFRGPPSLREAMDQGKIGSTLELMKQVPQDTEGCNEFERVLLRDLEIAQKYMQRVMTKCNDERLKNRAFFAQANLLAGGVISMLEPFQERMKDFHDRSGQA